MSRLTKTDRATLYSILGDMERAHAYIMLDRIAVCTIDMVATTSRHHTRAYLPGVDKTEADARPLYRVAKEYGSDLCRLGEAISHLSAFLTSH